MVQNKGLKTPQEYQVWVVPQRTDWPSGQGVRLEI